MKKIIITLGITTVFLFILYFGISLLIAFTLSQPSKVHFNEASSVVSPDGIDATFKTSDQVTISGWYFPSSASPSCVAILVPGFGQTRISSEYGNVKIARDLIGEGYGVLMFDPRGSGLSTNTQLGFGSTEGRDVLGAVKYLNSQGVPSKNIGILANSLGAIATLQFLPQLKDVGAIVADSPATTIQPLVENSLRERNIPSFLYPGIFIAAKYILGVDVPSVRPIDMVTNSQREILYLHAEKDKTIPLQNSKDLLAASNPKSKLIVFPNAQHSQTYKTDPVKYRTEVFSFLSLQLPQCN